MAREGILVLCLTSKLLLWAQAGLVSLSYYSLLVQSWQEACCFVKYRHALAWLLGCAWQVALLLVDTRGYLWFLYWLSMLWYCFHLYNLSKSQGNPVTQMILQRPVSAMFSGFPLSQILMLSFLSWPHLPALIPSLIYLSTQWLMILRARSGPSHTAWV